MEKMLIQAEVKAMESGNFQVVASTGDVDRMGDRINPEGWFLSNYKKNPVMLWGHDSSIPAIARAEKVWIENNRLMVEGKFAPTPFAQELRVLVESGFLSTVSVGFLPLKADEKGNIEIESKMYSRMTDDEVKKSVYDNEYGIKFDKQELLEVSWVNVPALPQALVVARKEGLALITKALEGMTKDEPKEEEKKIEDEIEQKEGRVLSTKTLNTIKKSISSMGEAINALENLLTDVEADKSIAPEKDPKSTTHEVAKKRVSPELRYLRTAYKAIEQVIIKEKNK